MILTRCAVLLRGINVGRHNQLPMADLRSLLTDLGAYEVVTHLRSGQAVVSVPVVEVERLAGRVEAALRERAGLRVAVLTRTAAELADLVANNPYPHLAATPDRLHAVFLAAQPDPARVAAIGTKHGGDEFIVGDRALYVAYAAGSYAAPVGKALAKLGGVQTARNWRTTLKLAELAAS